MIASRIVNSKTGHTSGCRTAAPAIAAVVAFGLTLTFTGQGSAQDAEPSYMFVQVAKTLETDDTAKTLRLVNVGRQTVYFSDRPMRVAGQTNMADYLAEWTSQAGSDNFGGDPPNAVVSVIEPGQADSAIAVVEISDPKMDGADLVYAYTLLDGKIPESGGTATLFIDSIGWDELSVGHPNPDSIHEVGATPHSDR